MPETSVIVTAYNEDKEISNCIKSLLLQSCKSFEIVIIDNGSKDNTYKTAKKYPVRVFRTEKNTGPGGGRNFGAKKARGKILVFVDADMTFDKDYLKNLVKPFKDKKVIGTTHDYEEVKNVTNIWSRCWGKIRVDKSNVGKITIFRAIRKDKFMEMGGFDPKYGYADDQTFWLKYKIRPVIASNTICYHKNPETLKAVFKHSRWIGASIDNSLLSLPLMKYIMPVLLAIISPVAIPVLAVKKCYSNKDFIIFPAMLVFMIMRYFGTVSGLTRKIYFNQNVD